MSFRKSLAVALLAVSAIPTLVPTATAASAANPPCVLHQYGVSSVMPLKTDVRVGKISYSHLAGAVVHIPARPGLTAEWLRAELGRYVASSQASATSSCALDVGTLRFEVASAGAGFDVKLVARDLSKAEEVLRRARLLVG